VQDRETRTISYQGAVLELAGVPVLYLPFFAHPDPSVQRASGLLPPNIGRNQRLGTFYEQPYYWAISPTQDLTASLRLHGNVNPLLGIQYRKRFWSGQLEFDTTMTQEREFDSDGDRLGDSRFRYSVLAKAHSASMIIGIGASASKTSMMTNISAATISTVRANAAGFTSAKTRV
jgi:LPS-assembly protein